jgi:hypothetical protein
MSRYTWKLFTRHRRVIHRRCGDVWDLARERMMDRALEPYNKLGQRRWRIAQRHLGCMLIWPSGGRCRPATLWYSPPYLVWRNVAEMEGK